MFNKKTVFILGAGASWHYGYPTGEDLVRGVREKAEIILWEYKTPNEDGKAALVFPDTYPRNYKSNFMEAFHNKLVEIRGRLVQANPLVIDDFLGRNEDIADIGKLLIAMVILECESKSTPRSSQKGERGEYLAGGDWIRYIVQQLTIGCEKPEQLLANKVTFITFNYDLSLELRLHRALKNYRWFADGGISDQFFSKERIYHVYGKLYDFEPDHPDPPAASYNNKSFPLANEIDRAYDASKNIRTISPDEKTIDTDIPEAIAKAEYLYFLGYGFDRRNNELLQLGQRTDYIGWQYVNFTNFGNSNKVSKSVERAYHLIHEDYVSGSPYGDLLGDHYRKISNPTESEARFRCEKSIKSVYDALAEDFDWPE